MSISSTGVSARATKFFVAIGVVCVPAYFLVGAKANADSNDGQRHSLAKEFTLDKNGAGDGWSFRLVAEKDVADASPLLRVASRTANELWGSNFDAPPRMWSDPDGYWGIGRNDSGRELISTRNDTRWMPGAMLLHPKGNDGAHPAGLAICWAAPHDASIDLHYAFALAAGGSNGVGLRVVKCSSGGTTEIVALQGIGRRIAHFVQGLNVAKGDEIRFQLDTCGDAVGDIVSADVVVETRARTPGRPPAPQPSGGTVSEGSRIAFLAPAASAKSVQWRKNGAAISGATNPSYAIAAAALDDAADYTAVVDGVESAAAVLRVERADPLPERFASPTPRQTFAATLSEQETQLATNQLMRRFAASRKKLAADRYRPAYHFVSPESQLNDPNGLCFWQGRWHLFYQAYPPEEFPLAKDIPQRRQHWGHAVSDDLVRWRDLPYAIYPGVERMCFSGSTVVENDRVVAFYPGIHAGQMVAESRDPLLLNWEKLGGRPVESPSGDSCIWKEGDTYYGLIGADHLVSSQDLRTWKSHGPFIEASPFPLGDAAACPGFVPIGNKHLLVSFSHTFGGQYLLGDYDAQRHRFRPHAHGRFNHGRVSPGGVHAPSAAADGKGGVVNILNINDAKFSPDWDQILSLPQRLTLAEDAQLRVAPVEALAELRGKHVRIGVTKLPANEELVLDAVAGNTLELEVEIDPQEARWVQLNVLRSPKSEEQTSITFYNFDRALSVWYQTPGTISLDGSRSSQRDDVWLRPPETTTLERRGKPLVLRVFVDRSVVEVFAGGERYLAMRVYPGREDSVGVSLRAQGRDAVLKRLDAWQMQSIWQ